LPAAFLFVKTQTNKHMETYNDYTIHIPTRRKKTDQAREADFVEAIARQLFPGSKIARFTSHLEADVLTEVWAKGPSETAAKIMTALWRLRPCLERLMSNCDFVRMVTDKPKIKSEAERALLLGIGNYEPGRFLTRGAEPLLGLRPEDDYIELFDDHSVITFGSGRAYIGCLDCALPPGRKQQPGRWGVLQWPELLQPGESWPTKAEAESELAFHMQQDLPPSQIAGEEYGVYYDGVGWRCCLRKPLFPERFDTPEEAFAHCYKLYRLGWLKKTGIPLMPYPFDDSELFDLPSNLRRGPSEEPGGPVPLA
jgi:hypothetical protein